MDQEINQILLLLLAALFWAIIWVERDVFNYDERKAKEKISFWWIRTFSLVSILWWLSYILDELLWLHSIVIASMAIVWAFILVSYIYSVYKKEQLWMTTEIAVFLSFFMWIFVVSWKIKFAVILSIAISFILSLKDVLDKLKNSISREELSNTLKFAVISLVVLPLLPDYTYSIVDVFSYFWYEWNFFNIGIFYVKFFNPYSIWYFVVLMAAISYIWYILSKFIWEKNSIIASWAIWWLISSTAVTASMSEASKSDTNNTNMYVIATLLASTIMFIRVVIIVLFFNINLLSSILLPSFLMLLWMWFYILYFYLKSKKQLIGENPNIKSDYKSPFSIAPAIKFAIFVLFIKFVAAIWTEYKEFLWWDYFYYLLWTISWLADVDAISQTMAVDSNSWNILATVASMTIIIAVISNNLVKWTLAWRFGEKKFWKIVMWWFIFSMVFGLAGLFFI